MNKDTPAPKTVDRSAIESWEDEGGALKTAPPVARVGRINPIVVIALTALAGTFLYVFARTLASGKEK